jgi:Holliday junction resolvase RusA-like endonuclease
VPDNHPRRHDAVNFAKCTHDALEKLVYTTDHWLYDVRWIRAGVDVDHPRAELTITPL